MAQNDRDKGRIVEPGADVYEHLAEADKIHYHGLMTKAGTHKNPHIPGAKSCYAIVNGLKKEFPIHVNIGDVVTMVGVFDDREIPEVHIDHRPHHGQEETIIKPFDLDFDDIPEKVKFSIHRMRSLKDNTLKEIRRPPPKYVNIWVKLEYGDWICPVLFDEDGRPYIMAPAKHQETASLLDAIAEYRLRVKVYIREKQAEEILDLLKVATDFCSKCSSPLDTKGGAGEWLGYASGGGAIADVFSCRFCEHENIRFNKEFIAEHPEMELT